MTTRFGITRQGKSSQFESIDELMSDIRANYQGKTVELTSYQTNVSSDVFVSSDGEFFTTPSKEQPYDMANFLSEGELVLED